MANFHKAHILREKFKQIIAEKSEEIKGMFPKLNVSDENYSLFAGKILTGEKYFRFRCQPTTKKIPAFFDALKALSNGYLVVVDGETIEIAINDPEKLHEFLGPDNIYVEDGSVELIKG